MGSMRYKVQFMGKRQNCEWLILPRCHESTCRCTEGRQSSTKRSERNTAEYTLQLLSAFLDSSFDSPLVNREKGYRIEWVDGGREYEYTRQWLKSVRSKLIKSKLISLAENKDT